MTPKDYLIDQVKALCARYGVEVVAETAGVSAENLKQIIAGTKLPSGNPRGVGAKLQKALDAAYPDWSRLAGPLPAADSWPLDPFISREQWQSMRAEHRAAVAYEASKVAATLMQGTALSEPLPRKPLRTGTA